MVDKKIVDEDEGCALYVTGMGAGYRVLASLVALLDDDA
jgi:hypothetical protein